MFTPGNNVFPDAEYIADCQRDVDGRGDVDGVGGLLKLVWNLH